MRVLVSIVLFAMGGCSPASECQPRGGFPRRFKVTQVSLPAHRHEFATDLYGDGTLINGLGNIVGELASYQINSQDVVNQALADGTEQLLLDMQSEDAAGRDAAGASVTLTDLTSGQRSLFCGNLRGGVFQSAPITRLSPLVTMTLSQPLEPLADPMHVPLTALELRFSVGADGALSGQLNGAVREADIAGTFVPSFAQWVNRAKLPYEAMDGAFHENFDLGGNDDPVHPSGCRNANGTPACRNLFGPDAGRCALAHDEIASTCEVATNAIIRNQLAPDVALFLADGTYAPGERIGIGDRDALTFGIGLVARPQSHD